MKKNYLLLALACTLLATANAPTAGAQEVSGAVNPGVSSLPVAVSGMSTDTKYNYKCFEVNAPEAGEYYTEFWLLPAGLSDKTFSAFHVYVNDSYVGDIKPSAGNWQSAGVEGHEKLALSKGRNVIAVATPAPQVPGVESIKVARDRPDAAISSAAYEKYLRESAAGVTHDVPAEEEAEMPAAGSTGTRPAHFSNVPLNYTFYSMYSLEEGKQLSVTTTSKSAHTIDIVYYGYAPDTITVPANAAVADPEVSGPSKIGIGGDSDIPVTSFKPRQLAGYVYATSEEMQDERLNQVYFSNPTANSSRHVATAAFLIPKTGQYLVRVHHADDGGSDVANIIVNCEESYYYENMPITLSYRECVIPADGNTYASMTCCNDFGTDDPYLFIHKKDNSGAGRIIGYNDDGPEDKINENDLSEWDSYISQRYTTMSGGISVSNFSSLNPRSRCSIFARIMEDEARSAMKTRGKDRDTAGVSGTSAIEGSVRVTGPGDTGGTLAVAAGERIEGISVYGLAGGLVGSVRCGRTSAEVPASELNMTRPGMYVISVRTVGGITSRKILVK